jgi:ABC-type transport system involved in multi-copper enzyme maturation permease subunit
MLTQTAALFLDAYRELNAKRMFWIVLMLSLVVVVAFAGTGIDAQGITLFGWQFKAPVINTNVISRALWYKYLFSNFGVGFWLTLVGMVLALISTAGIVPDFIAGGSVDLYLCRPISRLRLFLTKFLTGLLFVTLQVCLFTTACFLVLGIRGGVWAPRIFLAIPLVVLVFSYLFSFCVLVGLLTRSTIASLLLTILFWLLIFGVDVSEKATLTARIAGDMETTAYANRFVYNDKERALAQEKKQAGDPAADQDLQRIQTERAALEEKKRKSDPGRQNMATAHRILYATKTFLPKTSETNSLLDRWLDVTDDIADERRERRAQRRRTGGWFPTFSDRTEVRVDDPDVGREAEDQLRDRPVSWVIGTSLAFEAVVLALAAWIFVRRDY